MKKLISLTLAIMMIMCLSTTAFATTAEVPGDYTAEVTGSYVAGWDSNGIVYCVDIEWGDLDFTYHAEKGAIWNPETLTYSEVEPAYWEGEGTITVTNSSNTKISATPKYVCADGYRDAAMTFDTDKLKVASAESGTAQVGTITVTPSGFLPAMEDSDTIGTITLTIAQDTDVTVEEALALCDAMDALRAEYLSAGGDMNDDVYYSGVASLRQIATTFPNEQESLNSYYERVKTEYHNLKAAMDALSNS